MNDVAAIAPVIKKVRVEAPLEHAFEVFTAGLVRWWPRTHGIGGKPIAKVMMEPKLGGRWLEVAEDGTETLVATVIGWTPPHRVTFVWQVNAQWKPDASMRSEVDVRFAADGAATNVELIHHRFDTMGAAAGAKMRGDVDGGWPGLLQRFVEAAEQAG
jgi:uncharacterized protein YndB with AHSA1/START domain